MGKQNSKIKDQGDIVEYKKKPKKSKCWGACLNEKGGPGKQNSKIKD